MRGGPLFLFCLITGLLRHGASQIVLHFVWFNDDPANFYHEAMRSAMDILKYDLGIQQRNVTSLRMARGIANLDLTPIHLPLIILSHNKEQTLYSHPPTPSYILSWVYTQLQEKSRPFLHLDDPLALKSYISGCWRLLVCMGQCSEPLSRFAKTRPSWAVLVHFENSTQSDQADTNSSDHLKPQYHLYEFEELISATSELENLPTSPLPVIASVHPNHFPELLGQKENELELYFLCNRTLFVKLQRNLTELNREILPLTWTPSELFKDAFQDYFGLWSSGNLPAFVLLAPHPNEPPVVHVKLVENTELSHSSLVQVASEFVAAVKDHRWPRHIRSQTFDEGLALKSGNFSRNELDTWLRSSNPTDVDLVFFIYLSFDWTSLYILNSVVGNIQRAVSASPELKTKLRVVTIDGAKNDLRNLHPDLYLRTLPQLYMFANNTLFRYVGSQTRLSVLMFIKEHLSCESVYPDLYR